MPLERSTEDPINESDAIRFAMMDGKTRIVCIVTGEALNDVTGSLGLDDSGRMRAFQLNRSKIETAASKQYDAGETRPMVRGADLT